MKYKAKITVKDKLGFIIFVSEFLTVTKAKESLKNNNYIRVKKLINKDKTIIVDNQKLNLNDYINLVNENNIKTKNQFLYRNTINRKYTAILEF